MTEWVTLTGVLVQGYRVASGPSKDYPYGALDRQRPVFKQRGLDLEGYFNGSLQSGIAICSGYHFVFKPFIFHQIKYQGFIAFALLEQFHKLCVAW